MGLKFAFVTLWLNKKLILSQIHRAAKHQQYQEKAQRYSEYFFNLNCRTWEDVSQILGEKELSDTLRKYVSNRKQTAKAIVSKTFETAIADFLNKKIFESFSSPDIPSQKTTFLVGSGKERCDIFLGSCPGSHVLAINAKLNLGDRSSYQHPISPEFIHCKDNAFCVGNIKQGCEIVTSVPHNARCFEGQLVS